METKKDYDREDTGLDNVHPLATKEKLSPHDIQVMITETRRRDMLEEKAWEALDKKLAPRNVCCRRCKGDGKVYSRTGVEKDCPLCAGEGVETLEADSKMIEMVLSPKFPKTSISLNADINKMSSADLYDFIDRL